MFFISTIRNTIYLPLFSFSVQTTNHILTKLAKIGLRILNENICARRYFDKIWKSTPYLAEPRKLYNIFISKIVQPDPLLRSKAVNKKRVLRSWVQILRGKTP